MQKRILPTMIGALLMGGVGIAAADVTLFGHIDTSVDATDVDGGDDDINLNCTTCSVGFKGSEDLGNGLKAIFSIDFQYDTTERNNSRPSTTKISLTPSSPLGSYLGLTTTTTVSLVTGVGTSAITDRDQWLGLAGNFGKVRIGTISTGYKSHGAMLDPFYRTSLEGRAHGLQSTFHSGAGEDLQGRATNTVRYDSPSFNGLKLVGHYTFDSGPKGPFGEDDDPFGIGASYENGGMLVFADYMDNGQGGALEKEAWKIGGKYTMGMFSFSGQYEDYSNNASDDETVWQVAGTAGPLFGITGYLGFGMGEDDTSNDEYTAWTLAVMHNMSKRTMLYGGFSQVDCDAPKTLSVCRAVGSGGGEDDKFSVGLKHKF
jgi:predicted porin